MKISPVRHVSVLLVTIAGTCFAGGANTVRETRPLTLMRLRFGPHIPHPESNESWSKPSHQRRRTKPIDIVLFWRGGQPTGGFRAIVIESGGAEADGGTPGKEAAETQVPRDLFPQPLWVDKLKREGDQLNGSIGVGFFPARPLVYHIEAEIEGTEIGGTFTHELAKKAGKQWPLKGTVISGAELDALRKSEALAAGADWPNWKGPNYDCRAVPPSGPMVDHWRFARMVWVSEARLAGGGGGAGHPHPVSTRTDYNGPLVADGRVIFATTERSASSPAWPGFLAARAGKKGGKEMATRYAADPAYRRWVDHASAIILDDVVYCMDASTGATLWKTVLRDRGTSGNLTGKGKGGMWSTGVLDGDNFYFMGESGWLYCLDTASGKVVWESREANPERISGFEKNLALLKKGEIELPLDDPRKAGRGSMDSTVSSRIGEVHQVQGSLSMVAGVLVCPSGNESGGNMVGIDPATGERLWGPLSDVRAGKWSPAPWRHDGREYIVSGRACLEPRSGKVLWKVDLATDKECDGVVVGDVMVVPGMRYDPGKSDGKSGTCAYRLTPQSAEKLWEIDQKEKTAPYRVTMAADPDRGFVAYKAGHSEAFVLDLKKGAILDRKYIGNKLWGGNALMGDRLIDGQTRMCRITPEGKIEYLGSLNGIRFTCTTPALADGRVFVRAPYGIVCYDLRKKN